MARRGRLSKGCETCRKRKIKCDQLLPGCSQCRKSGWVCPQYGDTVERMFQYQDPICSKRTVKNSFDPAVTVGENIVWKPLPREVTQSLTDRAVAYFLHTHALRDNGEIRGCFEYLLTLDMSSMNVASVCLSAAGLAAYGNVARRPDVLKEARRHYGRSLRLVNRALQDRQKAAETSTMISILLLNSFEALTSDTMDSMAYSDGHMRGVMMVMHLRGPSLMDSRQGLQVFLHMCRCLITYSIMKPAEVPKEVIGLRRHAARFLDTRNLAWRLEELMIKLAKWRADVEAGVVDGPMDVIDGASELDDELFQLTSELRSYGPSGAAVDHESGSPLAEDKHVYPDFWSAYIGNYARTSRLILHWLIQEQLATQDALGFPLQKKLDLLLQSAHTCQELTRAICASIPNYCDDTPGRFNYDRVAAPIPTIAGTYFLLWPVMTAGHLTKSTELREWIIDQCRSIGLVTGIRRADAISGVLQRGENIFHKRENIKNTLKPGDEAGLPKCEPLPDFE